MNSTIVFVHGFASSNKGTKAQYLAQKCATRSQLDFHAIDLNPTPRDFEFMTVTGMINRLRQYILDLEIKRFHLIGSSMGGLVSLHYAHRFSGVEKLLLLAPVLSYWTIPSEEERARWQKAGVAPVFHYAFEKEIPLRYTLETDGRLYSDYVAPAVPTQIIHGRQDESVPIERSRDYSQHYPQVQLLEIEAEHTLNQHLNFIWQQVQLFLLNNTTA